LRRRFRGARFAAVIDRPDAAARYHERLPSRWKDGDPATRGGGLRLKIAFAFLLLAYFLYFNWEGLWAHFAADDMMNMAEYARVPPLRHILHQFMPWRGFNRPLGAAYYVPLLHLFGLNPLAYHAVLLSILAGNLWLLYAFARAIGCGELQAGLAALFAAYHAGLSVLYYNTAFIYDVLCFSFYMAAFVYYARVRASGRVARSRETAVFLLLYLCSLNAKEMALTMPIMLLAYEWYYQRPAWRRWRDGLEWLRGPGRIVFLAGLLNLVYLYGKAFGPDPIMALPAYRPVFSLRRLFAFEKRALYDLSLFSGPFGWKGVVAVWLALLYLAWRRKRPVLRFSWVFLMLAPLPIAFLEGRGGACLYIPYAGWAVFAAVLLTDTAGAAARFLVGEPVFHWMGRRALCGALLVLSVFYWARANDYQRKEFIRPAMADLGRVTYSTIRQLQSLNPRLDPNSHVVFLNDPFEGWDISFIAELWFRDPSIHYYVHRLTPVAESDQRKMTVFAFQDGRLAQVR
jgi:hypothetical protein